MRKFFLRAAILATLLVILGGVFMLFLSQVRPLRPGNMLFPIQYLAERQRAGITLDPYNRAIFELTLLERRIDDLVVRTGTRHEATAIRYLDLALDHASDAVARAVTDDPNHQADFQARLLILVQHLQEVLTALQNAPNDSPEIFQALQAKVTALARLLDNATANLSNLDELSGSDPTTDVSPQASPTPGNISSLDPQSVPFLPGSAGAEHLFYPLVGQHATLECVSCHPSEQYAGTANTCVACHQNVLPVNHFQGDCATCHNPSSWQDATFDHALYGATDCIVCHTAAKPANHFGGQCSACHSTSAWIPATFDHSAVNTSNCQSCHSGDTPANHFAGQCSNCHNTSNWNNVNFDHTGFTDCQACHSGNAPANHYSGQCSNCHNTSNWANVNFDHSGRTNCTDCHSGDAPANHFSGQCSNCHSTNTWAGASIDHTGLTNCTDCHSGDAPANHFSGQCSNCHNTNGWGGATIDHTGLTNCSDCHTPPSNHFSGQCSNCHNTNNWGNANFDHSGQTNCSDCHNPPSNHYAGQCSQCHSTNNWNFDHNNGLNCLNCHAGDEPGDEDHPHGQQCSDCHNTNDWDDAEGGDSDNTNILELNPLQALLMLPNTPAMPTQLSSHQLGTCSVCHTPTPLGIAQK